MQVSGAPLPRTNNEALISPCLRRRVTSFFSPHSTAVDETPTAIMVEQAVLDHLDHLTCEAGLSKEALNHLSIAQYAQTKWIAGKAVPTLLGTKRKAAEARAKNIAKASRYRAQMPKKAMLIAANAACREDAIQAARNILGFLEVRTSSKAPFDHAKKLCRTAISAQASRSSYLVDEIFCQLMRATVGNDDEAVLLRAWHLFALIAGCVDPTPELVPYLAACAEAAASHAWASAATAESWYGRCALTAAATHRLVTKRAAARLAAARLATHRREAIARGGKSVVLRGAALATKIAR